ncbi:uncharacterized protein LOC131938444 [Physella acuta]|uniref:uncharacterized protein LOC131938444 n=1 Tax=Physella acuta TaxID=109671 RepID=UPI0027DB8F7B|nr:uncharacterized protein LOC131938444 [Physella acuta]XP_059152461.1 uncharacterized protein LOC131938444 [Physella acuta]
MPVTSQYIVVTATGNSIHLFELVSAVTVRIECPHSVNSVSVINSEIASYAFIATNDNKLWRTRLSEFDGQMKGTGTSTCRRKSIPEDLPNSEDIFGDLLKQQENRQEMFNHMSDSKIKQSINEKFRRIILKQEELVYQSDSNILEVQVHEKLITLLVDDSGSVQLCVLVWDVENNKLKILQNVATNLSLKLFVSPSDERKRIMYLVSQYEEEPSQGERTTHLDPQLHFCRSSIYLPKTLFISLFGKENSCLNSLIVLLSTNDGCVYSYSTKTMNPLNSKFGLICQMNSEVISIMEIDVALPKMCSGENEGIVSALAAALDKGSNNSQFNEKSTMEGLLICFATGECCMYLTPDEENKIPSVLVFSLPHSIGSCIKYKNHCVYSTGTSIEASKFTLSKLAGSDDVLMTPVLQTVFKKARISKLSAVLPTDQDTGSLTLLAVTCSYESVFLPITILDSTKTPAPKSAHSFTEILHNIDLCSQRFKEVKETSKLIDTFLLQMNIFCHLQQSLEGRKSTNRNQQASLELLDLNINCIFNISSFQNVYRKDWALKVYLENRSPVLLSKDWSLLVTVKAFSAKQTSWTESHSVRSYCFPLNKGLLPNSKVDFLIPLTFLNQLLFFPTIRVTANLILNMPDSLEMVLSQKLHKCLSVELSKHEFDILNFIYPPSDETNMDLVSNRENHLHKELCQMAHMRVGNKFKSNDQLVKSESFTVRLLISKTFAQMKLLGSAEDVLKFLFTKDQEVKLDETSSCMLITPSGQLLTVTVSSAAKNPAKSLRPAANDQFNIALTSSDLTELFAIRSAVKSRLKMSLNEDVFAHSKYILQQQLNTLEKLRENLRKGPGKDQSSVSGAGGFLCELLDTLDETDI